MSESLIYNRSLGRTYDSDALAREVAEGTAGHDVVIEEPDYDELTIGAPLSELDNLRNDRMLWNMVEATAGGLDEEQRAEVVLLEAEIIFQEFELKLTKCIDENPKYTLQVSRVLSERLDDMKEQGHAVDAEMYIQARQLADEIVAANPDKNADELSDIVTAMVGMMKAEYKIRELTLAA